MTGGSLVEWRVAGSALQTRSMQADDVGMVAKGTPVWGRCFGPSEAIIISFNRRFLELVARQSVSGDIELKSLSHTSDRQIRTLGILLDRDTRAGCPTGRLYGESLGMALAVHVLRTYSVSPPRAVQYRGGLPRYQLRHVMDYIISNLPEDNSPSGTGGPTPNESFPFLSLIQGKYGSISAPMHS